jgi:hypothetical protein
MNQPRDDMRSKYRAAIWACRDTSNADIPTSASVFVDLQGLSPRVPFFW